MGVSTNYYTIYGVKLDWNDEFHTAWDDVYGDKDTPFVLSDGYRCEYIILGKILFDSGDQRGLEIKDSFVEINMDSLPDIEANYRAEFVAKFPQFAYLVDKPFKIMTLVHYS